MKKYRPSCIYCSNKLEEKKMNTCKRLNIEIPNIECFTICSLFSTRYDEIDKKDTVLLYLEKDMLYYYSPNTDHAPVELDKKENIRGKIVSAYVLRYEDEIVVRLKGENLLFLGNETIITEQSLDVKIPGKIKTGDLVVSATKDGPIVGKSRYIEIRSEEDNNYTLLVSWIEEMRKKMAANEALSRRFSEIGLPVFAEYRAYENTCLLRKNKLFLSLLSS